MNCPECRARLLPGVPFCRCGWPEKKAAPKQEKNDFPSRLDEVLNQKKFARIAREQASRTLTIALEGRTRKEKRLAEIAQEMQSSDLAEEIGVLVLDAVLYGKVRPLQKALRLAQESSAKVLREQAEDEAAE